MLLIDVQGRVTLVSVTLQSPQRIRSARPGAPSSLGACKLRAANHRICVLFTWRHLILTFNVSSLEVVKFAFCLFLKISKNFLSSPLESIFDGSGRIIFLIFKILYSL